jgi:hypothetical protein
MVRRSHREQPSRTEQYHELIIMSQMRTLDGVGVREQGDGVRVNKPQPSQDQRDGAPKGYMIFAGEFRSSDE